MKPGYDCEPQLTEAGWQCRHCGRPFNDPKARINCPRKKLPELVPIDETIKRQAGEAKREQDVALDCEHRGKKLEQRVGDRCGHRGEVFWVYECELFNEPCVLRRLCTQMTERQCLTCILNGENVAE